MNKLVNTKIEKNIFIKTYFNNYYIAKDMYINEIVILKYLNKRKINFIPKLISFFSYNQKYEIKLEKINGKTLEKYKFKNIKEKISLFKKLLEIVNTLHENSVIHNDLTPKNIIVNGKEVYLVDFACSSFINYKSYIVSATDGFSAIEKYSKAYTNAFQTDIYSLSSILIYLIFNYIPDSSYIRYFIKNQEYYINDKINAFFEEAFHVEKYKRIKNMKEYIEKFEAIENELLQLWRINK